ncbi:hypothetical protein [Miltoncostaea oceani]|uniref:hypothetical protein n=1 Tax=Miltoncostaea oceani TaxID=2843216 RepID=UPI001C3D87B1|nr:hypothetical protein [Miltoncostaea oceani]
MYVLLSAAIGSGATEQPRLAFELGPGLTSIFVDGTLVPLGDSNGLSFYTGQVAQPGTGTTLSCIAAVNDETSGMNCDTAERATRQGVAVFLARRNQKYTAGLALPSASAEVKVETVAMSRSGRLASFEVPTDVSKAEVVAGGTRSILPLPRVGPPPDALPSE